MAQSRRRRRRRKFARKARGVFSSLPIEKMNICQTHTKKRPADNGPAEAVNLQGRVCHAQLQVSHFTESSRSDWLHPPAPMTNPGDEKQIPIWIAPWSREDVGGAAPEALNVIGSRPCPNESVIESKPAGWRGEGNYKWAFRQEGHRRILSLILPAARETSSARIHSDRGDVVKYTVGQNLKLGQNCGPPKNHPLDVTVNRFIWTQTSFVSTWRRKNPNTIQ